MGAIANALFRCQSDDDNPQRLANQHLNIGSNCTRAPLWQLSTFLMDSATAWVHAFRWPGSQPTWSFSRFVGSVAIVCQVG
jgi:hypothetical protein